MFALNKEARKFILNNFLSIRNGFENEGLIEYEFYEYLPTIYNRYETLDKLYLKALSRNIQNRKLTINVPIIYLKNLTIFD